MQSPAAGHDRRGFHAPVPSPVEEPDDLTFDSDARAAEDAATRVALDLLIGPGGDAGAPAESVVRERLLAAIAEAKAAQRPQLADALGHWVELLDGRRP